MSNNLNGNHAVELPNVFSRQSLPVTVDDIPRQTDVDKWTYLKGIHVPHIDAGIELLIGNDAPKVLEPKEIRESKDVGPFAVRTLFGWTINGPLGRMSSSSGTANRIQSSVDLSTQFEKFCEMEFNDSQFGVEKTLSQEHKRALTMMEQSVRLSDGRYEVALPWKVFPPNLPNNKMRAEQRLLSLKKRLVRDPKLHLKYSAFMNDLLEKGYARRVPDDQESKSGWYLPHHAVIHPHKPNEVRVVFNCVARFQGASLNERIMQGPDLTNTLIGVLSRFRQESTAVMADVEQMFYQVLVPDEDCNFLRYLWWPNGDINRAPQEFQMRVHVFGCVSSPSCASFALRRRATDNQDHFDKETVETVRKNFYVDDCLKSVKSEQDAVRLTGKLRDLDLDHLPVERALGIQWDVPSDVFRFKIAVKNRPETRRGILSVMSSVYDPLGFLSPFILQAKTILRDLCEEGLNWDDPIPPAYQARWRAWLEELPKLQQFSVGRCLKPKDFGDVVTCQLHTFSDASQHGYGAVTYLRVVNSSGDVHCSFLVGKSRQTPKTSVTIPRLELSAAVVATRLNLMMRHELDVVIDYSILWSHSTCVLSYIANQDKRFQTFVANRIAAIHEGSRVSDWKYVDTRSNPADDALRGLSAEELIGSKRWISGPAFLWEEESSWPEQQNIVREVPEDDPEVKKEAKTAAAVIQVTGENDVIDRIICHFSSRFRLKKCIAWILRYRLRLLQACRRCKACVVKQPVTDKPEPISVKEMKTAEVEMLRHVQKQSFVEAIRLARNEKKEGCNPPATERKKPCLVKKSSSIYKLDPVIVNGLMCVGGRLSHAPIQEESKHPVILPKKHHVVDLISGHSGKEHVLSLIREKFWIIKARVAVRIVINHCFSCKRRQGPVGVQKMADLPADRVTPGKPLFSFVGVDCFGPFVVKRGRSQVKRYGVLYTCLVTRAVHIEVAQRMDTDSFINSVRRFIAWRGTPELIRSDNGTNFVGGNKEIRSAISQWNEQQIHGFFLQRHIKWIFNPPSGSHHGGVWERCIRTVRKVLNAVLKEHVLNDEGLSTFMCEVEAIVNSRPLTRSSDDPNIPKH